LFSWAATSLGAGRVADLDHQRAHALAGVGFAQHPQGVARHDQRGLDDVGIAGGDDGDRDGLAVIERLVALLDAQPLQGGLVDGHGIGLAQSLDHRWV
jgi:hypothetical protein